MTGSASGSEVPNVNHGGAYSAEEYQRKPDHVANTGHENEESYVLVLLTDKRHHKAMTSIRDQYFPAKLNKLEAHVALFRALPGSQLSTIRQDLYAVTQTQTKFRIEADYPFRLGHGIGINVRKSPAQDVYNELKSRWNQFLSKQDQSFRAHYTVQNKVDDTKEVDRAFQELKREYKFSEGQVEGLALYRYVKGFWKDRQDFLFKS